MIWVLNFQIIRLVNSYLPFKAWKFVLGSAFLSQKNSLSEDYFRCQLGNLLSPQRTHSPVSEICKIQCPDSDFCSDSVAYNIMIISVLYIFVPLSLKPSQNSAPPELSLEIHFPQQFVNLVDFTEDMCGHKRAISMSLSFLSLLSPFSHPLSSFSEAKQILHLLSA